MKQALVQPNELVLAVGKHANRAGENVQLNADRGAAGHEHALTLLEGHGDEGSVLPNATRPSGDHGASPELVINLVANLVRHGGQEEPSRRLLGLNICLNDDQVIHAVKSSGEMSMRTARVDIADLAETTRAA
eukprot:CAMPEP_0185191900 /NCGR_PEP_ID=MMETSP1140-20130426/17649_1 /TAXON_ID=298111 /ORGANISM="Pavlova sp., Strain CCMP459" /LENGTH=132 /DNA_ID=CAMNT_0027758625 /DNA_START=522 /DNA_END=917 /DNA_ORIENTATION=+